MRWNFVSSSRDRIEEAKRLWASGTFGKLKVRLDPFRCLELGTILERSSGNMLENMLTSPSKKATDKPEMFDTLGISTQLKRARASQPVAREIAMAMGEIVQSQLATKEDLLFVRRDFQDAKQELKLQISCVQD